MYWIIGGLWFDGNNIRRHSHREYATLKRGHCLSYYDWHIMWFCVLVHDLSFGRVGSPLSLLDFRLVNWNEGGYRVSNKPFPQGEIIIGGYSVARGYYKSDAITAENFFDEDGRRWFKTGDIGEFHEDGVMRIIGKFWLNSHYRIVIELINENCVNICRSQKGFSEITVWWIHFTRQNWNWNENMSNYWWYLRLCWFNERFLYCIDYAKSKALDWTCICA